MYYFKSFHISRRNAQRAPWLAYDAACWRSVAYRTKGGIQKAQLSQRDRATLYVHKFMLCFMRFGS